MRVNPKPTAVSSSRHYDGGNVVQYLQTLATEAEREPDPRRMRAALRYGFVRLASHVADGALREQLCASLDVEPDSVSDYVPPVARVGAVWGLFATVEAGQPLGMSRRVQVVRSGTEPDGDDDAASSVDRRVLRDAVDAVRSMVNREASVADQPDCWHVMYLPMKLMNDVAVEFLPIPGWTPNAQGKYDGGSLGLPLALAAFSELTGTPVPTSVAATGTVTSDGRVGEAEYIAAKTRSLLIEHPEVERVLVPMGPIPDRGDLPLEPVATVKDALTAVFGNWADIYQRSLQAHDGDAVVSGMLRLRLRPPGSVYREHYMLDIALRALDRHLFSTLRRDGVVDRIAKALPPRAKVILDGRAPLWLTAHLADVFANQIDTLAVKNLGQSAAYIITGDMPGGEAVVPLDSLLVPQQKNVTWLLNAFSIQMLADLRGTARFTPIGADEARSLAASGLRSAIGHNATAELLSEVLGTDVPVVRDRIKLETGDAALVAQLHMERLPEGVVPTVDDLRALDLSFVRVDVLE